MLLKDEKYYAILKKTEKMDQFFVVHCPDCSGSNEIMELIEDFKIVQKYDDGYKNKNNKFYKLIWFVYECIMDFLLTNEVKGAIISENFLSNIHYLINGKTVIHHSHITGDIVGQAHSFCNLKVRENNQISVIAHSLFGFDSFFF